jgi:hypothetical protein
MTCRKYYRESVLKVLPTGEYLGGANVGTH